MTEKIRPTIRHIPGYNHILGRVEPESRDELGARGVDILYGHYVVLKEDYRKLTEELDVPQRVWRHMRGEAFVEETHPAVISLVENALFKKSGENRK